MEVTFLTDVSLKAYNSLRLDAVASLMAFPHSHEGLVEVIEKYKEKKKFIVIGKGSNMLFKSAYYSEEYLFLNLKLLDRIELHGNDEIVVEAGATLTNLVWFAIENNIAGLEFLEDIPGTLGGAILMNAGTYKNYIGDFVKSVTYYDFNSKKIVEKKVSQSDFSRRSSFWSSYPSIILSCRLKGVRGDYINSLEEVQRIKKNRFMKQPRNYPSAGSVFVRPKVDLADKVVWELLDEVGLRGYTYNGAAYSKKHPGFIINLGSATFDDVNHLINLAQSKVEEKFQITLNVEWKIV